MTLADPSSDVDLLTISDLFLEREILSRSLPHFIRAAWHVLEPTTAFVPGFHIDAICEHLEAVTAGKIRNLLINIPPRHAKSLIVSVFWPVHEWITKPETRWLYASYAQSLSTRDSLKCRRLIDSPWFQERWRDKFSLTGDQNQKMRFDNDHTGYRIATSVEGFATGEGGSRVVVDDPHSVQDKESDAIRESTLIWWDETMSTRLNDQKTDAKVIVMQRVHQNDLSGHVLEQGGYVHLNLPAEYEPSRKCVTQIGWEDPRTEDGELLWPARVGKPELDELKRRLGPTAYAGQFQQRPAPAGGSLFKTECLTIIDPENLPKIIRAVRGWDMAATEGGGDYTVGVKIGVDEDQNFYVLDVRRIRESSAKVQKAVTSTAASDGTEVTIRLEQEPGSSGKALIEHYVKALAGYAVKSAPATGDKVIRATPFSTAVERKVVRLVKANWNDAYIDEMTFFPDSTNDDQIDASANAFNELTLGMRVSVNFAFKSFSVSG